MLLSNADMWQCISPMDSAYYVSCRELMIVSSTNTSGNSCGWALQLLHFEVSLNQLLSALPPGWSPLPQPLRLSQSLDRRWSSHKKSSRSASCSQLRFDSHARAVAKACAYHTHALRHVCHLLYCNVSVTVSKDWHADELPATSPWNQLIPYISFKHWTVHCEYQTVS